MCYLFGFFVFVTAGVHASQGGQIQKVLDPRLTNSYAQVGVQNSSVELAQSNKLLSTDLVNNNNTSMKAIQAGALEEGADKLLKNLTQNNQSIVLQHTEAIEEFNKFNASSAIVNSRTEDSSLSNVTLSWLQGSVDTESQSSQPGILSNLSNIISGVSTCANNCNKEMKISIEKCERSPFLSMGHNLGFSTVCLGYVWVTNGTSKEFRNIASSGKTKAVLLGVRALGIVVKGICRTTGGADNVFVDAIGWLGDEAGRIQTGMVATEAVAATFEAYERGRGKAEFLDSDEVMQKKYEGRRQYSLSNTSDGQLRIYARSEEDQNIYKTIEQELSTLLKKPLTNDKAKSDLVKILEKREKEKERLYEEEEKSIDCKEIDFLEDDEAEGCSANILAGNNEGNYLASLADVVLDLTAVKSYLKPFKKAQTRFPEGRNKAAADLRYYDALYTACCGLAHKYCGVTDFTGREYDDHPIYQMKRLLKLVKEGIVVLNSTDRATIEISTTGLLENGNGEQKKLFAVSNAFLLQKCIDKCADIVCLKKDNGLNRLCVPSALRAFSNLQQIVISGADEISPKILQLKKLFSLYIHNSSQGVGELLNQIGDGTQLQILQLSDNGLQIVPADMSCLTNLVVLSLINNQLSSIPVELTVLTQLTSLDLTGNRIEKMPKDFSRMAHVLKF